MTIVSINDPIIIGCVVAEHKPSCLRVSVTAEYEKACQLSGGRRCFRGRKEARAIADARGWRVIEGGAGDGKHIRIH